MRRGVAAVTGSVIESVEFPRIRARPIDVAPSRQGFRRKAVGRRIVDVGRIGKRVVLGLNDRQAMILEPRMTGLVLLADPPTREHLRLRLSLSNENPRRRELLFWDRRGLGSVHLLSPERLAALREEKLGPDALAITAEALRARLGRSRRAIKVALLDQAAVAGIGNLYAAEILHVAGVHPERRCDLLSKAQWRRIHAGMLDVLHEAIRYEGSTLSDGTYRNALNQAGGYQNEHRVYDRAGQTCRTCRRCEIVRIVQAQRSTYFCPKCQRRR